jgi:hypothetical protein
MVGPKLAPAGWLLKVLKAGMLLDTGAVNAGGKDKLLALAGLTVTSAVLLLALLADVGWACSGALARTPKQSPSTILRGMLFLDLKQLGAVKHGKVIQYRAGLVCCFNTVLADMQFKAKMPIRRKKRSK